jgi:hypothetical protein
MEIVLLFVQAKGKAVPLHPIKAYGVSVKFQRFLNSILQEGKWSVSYSDRFTLWEMPPVPIAGWVPQPVWTLWKREKFLGPDEIFYKNFYWFLQR